MKENPKQPSQTELFTPIDSADILPKIDEKIKNKIHLLQEKKRIESILAVHNDILEEHELVELQKQLSFIDKSLTKKNFKDEFREFIYTLNDFKNAKEFFWLVNQVIPSNSIGVFYGASGSGKTTLVLHFIGMILHQYPQVYIYYIDGDMGAQNIKNVGATTLMELFGERFVYAGKNIDNNFSETAQRFIEKVVHRQQEHTDRYCLLIEDSLNLIAKKRNGFVDVEQLYKLEKKLRSAGGGVVVIHHTNKQGLFADSQQIENYADYMYKVERNDFNNTLLLKPVKASRYDIEEKAYMIQDRKIAKEIPYSEANISSSEAQFIGEVQAILDDLGEINQSELIKELQMTLNTLKLGTKRAIKWLEKWASESKWCRVKRPEQKNAVVYFLYDEALQNCETGKLPNREENNRCNHQNI